MQNIELWDIAPDGQGGRDAIPMVAAPSDEAERLLEDLIVRQPNLLGRGIALIGRQLPTSGGPLDLIGVDQDGRIVVFELKRGLLTRDAVAQILDYASDLVEKGEEQLARLVETNSGRNGIPTLDDFADWYSQQYPDSDGPLSLPPRMILVGLGADERAKRITSFLTQRSVEIELLTFYAFRSENRLFFARLSESEVPKPSAVSPANKESNRRALHELAEQYGVKDLMEEIAAFVAIRLPGAYQWPGKSSYAFSLQEQTDAGRPTLRAYVTLYVDLKKKGNVVFYIVPRAARAGGEAVLSLVEGVGSQQARSPKTQYVEHEIRLDRGLWSRHKDLFDHALKAIYAGWQQSASQVNATAGRKVEPDVEGPGSATAALVGDPV
jgi:hypothetical protein